MAELVPQAGVIGLLVQSVPKSAGFVRYTRSMEDAAHTKGVQLVVMEVGSDDEIDAAFASLVSLHAGALVVQSNVFFTQRSQQLVTLARQQDNMPFRRFTIFAGSSRQGA